MTILTRVFFGAAVVVASLVTAAPAVAATFEVDDNRAQCPRASAKSIQAAVNASGPGDTILVCNGSYAGGVTIAGAQHSGLRLRAKVAGGANIRGSADVSDQFGVLITGGALNVEVSGFVIDAPAPAEFSGSTGISVETGSGASRIHGNAVRGGSTGISVAGKATEVTRNRIVSYRDTGIVVTGQADLVSHNEAFSPGSSQYGTTAFLAAAFGDRNPDARALFSDNTASGPGEVGFRVFGDASSSARFVFRRNTVRRHTYGVILEDSIGARIELNRITDGTFGILVDFRSHDNRFEHNTVLGNLSVDCRDDVDDDYGANTWIGNRGHTSEPPGLCTPRP